MSRVETNIFRVIIRRKQVIRILDAAVRRVIEVVHTHFTYNINKQASKCEVALKPQRAICYAANSYSDIV